MTKENMMQIHRIYSILLSIVIIISGICLIAACISIYKSGDHPFSRQAVSDAFSGIAFPVYLCLIMTILSFILDVVLPAEHKKSTAQKPYAHILKSLYSKKDLSQCDETLRNTIYAHQKARRLHSVIRTVIVVLSSGAFLLYALNGKNFDSSNINDSMIHAMYVLIPCLTVSFCYALFTLYYNEKSIKSELELLKQIPASDSTKAEDSETAGLSENKVSILRFVILAIAISILIYGFISGGTADVLAKAANICTECIGLG